ncbi:hypothetical protein CDAR_513481 [Caerostris darwini]|uniref:Uncharacterized protein n=1 Tax=Caerostris darwini TaxID=1538125 RepID=A0AAV4WVH8_9ARAC|nr:hypothetical protein CDAR_513481 [Caerostris darwini]
MENTTTLKISQRERSKFIRTSPSSSFRSPLIKTADKKIAFEYENASLEDMKKVILEMWQKNENLKKEIGVLKEE